MPWVRLRCPHGCRCRLSTGNYPTSRSPTSSTISEALGAIPRRPCQNRKWKIWGRPCATRRTRDKGSEVRQETLHMLTMITASLIFLPAMTGRSTGISGARNMQNICGPGATVHSVEFIKDVYPPVAKPGYNVMPPSTKSVVPTT